MPKINYSRAKKIGKVSVSRAKRVRKDFAAHVLSLASVENNMTTRLDSQVCSRVLAQASDDLGGLITTLSKHAHFLHSKVAISNPRRSGDMRVKLILAQHFEQRGRSM